MATVSELLRQSMTLHKQAADARNKRKANATQLLQEAYALRVQAHDMDPEHVDPEWTEEQQHTTMGKDTHAELMAFYAKKLG